MALYTLRCGTLAIHPYECEISTGTAASALAVWRAARVTLGGVQPTF